MCRSHSLKTRACETEAPVTLPHSWLILSKGWTAPSYLFNIRGRLSEGPSWPQTKISSLSSFKWHTAVQPAELLNSSCPQISLGAQLEAAFQAEAEGERTEEQSAAAPSRQPHHHGQETLPRYGRWGLHGVAPYSEILFLWWVFFFNVFDLCVLQTLHVAAPPAQAQAPQITVPTTSPMRTASLCHCLTTQR